MKTNKKIVSVILVCLVGILATGCSEDNPVAIEIPVDTAPPALPYDVAGDFVATSGVIALTWGVNTTDTDLVGYIVTRENRGNVVDIIAVPALVQTVEDTNPPAGTNLYQIYAVDLAGNTSAAQSVVVAIVLQHQSEDLQRQ